MDIILILGSVTPKQYQPLRLAMIRRGLEPKIRRIPRGANEDEFAVQAAAEWVTTNGPIKPWVFKREKELKKDLLQSSLRGNSLAEVKAIVYPLNSKSSDWDWVIEKNIHTLVPAYKVEQWLAGSGFGDILDIK